ncbi:MAG: DMT family transporter [Hyphomicrobiaceae bacterium]
MTADSSKPKPAIALEIAALLFVGFLWGGQFGLNKIQLETIPPFTGVALRLTVAAIFLWLIVAIRRDGVPRDPRRWRDFAIQGLLTSGGPGVMVMWSQQYIDSALAAILNSTTPICATLLTLLLVRHERIGLQKVIGLLVGLGGVVLVVGIDALKGIDKSFIGQIVVMLSALGYGGAALFGRRFGGISPVTAAAGATTCSALLLTVVSFSLERPLEIAPSARSLLALVTSAILCGGIAVILYYRLISTLGSIGASSLGYLKAAFGVLIGCFILGEPLTIAIMVGLAAVMIGVAAINEQLSWPRRQVERRA